MYNLKFKAGNEALNYEVSIKPKDYNTDDTSLSAKHASKFIPATGKFETTNGIKYGSPRVGPVRFWTSLDYVWDNKGQSLMKPSLSTQI